MSERPYYINKPNNVIPKNFCGDILSSSHSKVFFARQETYKVTELVPLPCLAKKFGVGNIFIKDESSRFGLNAFKALGAYYAVDSLLKSNPDVETICTATDGNHGRAISWSAGKYNRKAVVFVPEDTIAERIKAIRNEGARVEITKGNYDKACMEAAEACKKEDWALVQDTASVGYEEIPAIIMAGYLTLFEEMETSIHSLPVPGIDIVFLQAGVGSLAASGVWYYLNRYGLKRPKIVIVEPSEADALLCSFKKDTLSHTNGTSTTIMAGLNCQTPSTIAWEIIKNGADISIKIDDRYAEEAMKELYRPCGTDRKILSGESGAAGLGGFLAIISNEKYKPLIEELSIGPETRILFINTEGPIK